MKQTAKVIPYKRGTVITKPGIYSGIPMDVYHSANLCDGPSVSSSSLRTMWSKAPAYVWDKSPLNPDRTDPEDTEAFLLGRAAHHVLLGEDHFSTEYIARPDKINGEDWHGNKKICKAWLAEQRLQGRTVLTSEHLEQIRGMARSLKKNSLVQQGILNGDIEQSYIWKCPETGLWKKARPDSTPSDSGDFADLKTCTSVLDEEIKKSLRKYQYPQQGAMIAEGWYALTGSNASSFTLIFVEKKSPWCVRPVPIPDEDLARGEQQNRFMMRKFKRCLDAGYWPGPGEENELQFFGMPQEERARIDFRLDELAKQEDAA